MSSYLNAAKMVLEDSKRPLTINEIFNLIKDNGRDEGIKLSGDTLKKHTLSSQLYMNSLKENGIFYKASTKPTTFWLRGKNGEKGELDNEDLSNIEEKINKKGRFVERDLHPLLIKFISESQSFFLRAKTIYHEESKKNKSGRDKWRYPDIVGVHFYFGDYENETTKGFLEHRNQDCFKLYSFELKKTLDFSNLKESYFQAVSNSSWANYGYLVAFEIDDDDELLEELRRLNQNFGIGVIKLEKEVSESRILVHAREMDLDIKAIDDLIGKNKEFKNFISDVSNQIKQGAGGEVRGKFDKVLDDDELELHCREKHIY